MRSARFQIMFLHNACYRLIASLVAVLLSVFSWQHILNVKTAAYDRLDLFSLTDRGNGVRACVRYARRATCSFSQVSVCQYLWVPPFVCVCFFLQPCFVLGFFFFWTGEVWACPMFGPARRARFFWALLAAETERSRRGYKPGKQQQLEGVTHTVHINHPGPAYHKHTVKL